jgi:restriction endonuclease Mrr
MDLKETELLGKLRTIDAYAFERLVADLWEERGWETTVTSGSNDGGIDVIAEQHVPFQQKQLIQAKRYSRENLVGSPEIQQYSSLRRQVPGVDSVIIVTTSGFTAQAKETAHDLNVKLVDASALYEILTDLDAVGILEQYVDLPNEDGDGSTADRSRPGLHELIQTGSYSEPGEFHTHVRNLDREDILHVVRELFTHLGYEAQTDDLRGDFFDMIVSKQNIRAHVKVYFGSELSAPDLNTLNGRASNYSVSECLVFLIDSKLSKTAQHVELQDTIAVYDAEDLHRFVKNIAKKTQSEQTESSVDLGNSPTDVSPAPEDLAAKIEELRKRNGQFMNVVFDQNERFLQLAPQSIFNVSIASGGADSLSSIADTYEIPVIEELGRARTIGYRDETLDSEMMADITEDILSEVFDVSITEVDRLEIID